MAHGDAGDGPVGRLDVIDRLDAAVLGARPSSPVAVVGDPGIGKTALLHLLARRARDRGFLVLTATGSEGETALAFAALHQLLTPLTGEIDALPGPQRAALRCAFGLAPRDGDDGDFHVAIATLTLLGRSTRPVVLVVDDIGWIDPDSLTVLGFVARRGAAHDLRVAVGRRPGAPTPFDDVEEIALEPLPEADAEALLDRRHPDLSPTMRRRVLQLAEGNPLALEELPEALETGVAELALPLDAAPAVPLSHRLERAYARTVGVLPPTTAAILLIAATNSGSSVTEALRAASLRLGRSLDLDDLHPAVALGLVHDDGDELRFRHPLVRSGVLHAAPPPARRAAHRALADTLHEDPDRRAWHRSEVVPADEDVAADLAAAAERADRRGAPATAVVLWARAAARSRDAPARALRAARGAETAVATGDTATASRLLDDVDDTVVPWAPALRALCDQSRWGGSDPSEPGPFLAAMRRAVDAGRADLALQAVERVVGMSSPEVRRAAVAEVRRWPGTTATPAGLMVLAHDPHGVPEVREHTRRALAVDGLDPEAVRTYATVDTMIYEFGAATAALPGAAAALARSGRRVGAAQALVSLAWSLALTGRLRDARATVDRAVAEARETDQRFWVPGGLLCAAWLDALTPGADAEERVGQALREIPAGVPAPMHEAMAAMVRATAALAGARYAEAVTGFRALAAQRPEWVVWWSAAEHVEAAHLAGDADEARAALERLRTRADETGAAFLARRAAYGEALLADDADADDRFHRAAAAITEDDLVLAARLRLADGVRLRRRRRIREARCRLDEAAALLAEAGPTCWDALVARELAAAGVLGTARPTGLDVLTPQEHQVALLAARGLSNREIGARLLISPRTVSTHLHRTFRKLGVTHRRDLDVTVLTR